MTASIYLDYAATTPVDPAVADAMVNCLTLDGNFANPASRSHRLGWLAEEAVDVARHQIADVVNADAREIIFTSGATESNNLAIKGAMQALAKAGDKRNHIITLGTEHKAVLDVCAYLQTQGFEVSYLTPDKYGRFSAEQLKTSLQDNTALVTVMHVNNETGVTQDIAGLADVCRAEGVLLHCDAAQSVGKCKIDLQQLGVDLMSFSAHKAYGPKGIGALYIRRRPRVNVVAQIHGGAHERGFRSGTLPTHQIVGMGKAFELAEQLREQEAQRLSVLRDKLWAGLQQLSCVRLNGSLAHQVPHILNVSFGTLDSQQLMPALAPLAVSSGSACTSATMTPSHVLSAMGVSNEYAHSAIRLSIGRFTSEDEINFAISHIYEVVSKLTSA